LRHIPVRLRVTVDPEAWDRVFGTGTTHTAIAEDVRRYVVEQLNGSDARHEGAIVAVRRDGA
jgi:hypothetical protein